MGTYAVTVDFDEDVDKLTLSEIYDALGAQARREMTLTGGKPTSVGLNPVTFYLERARIGGFSRSIAWPI